ncbi:MAG: hypothetical protein REJ50_03165 [Bordetella sp.]|nr:hypothetical protein [Bordetella sp.]
MKAFFALMLAASALGFVKFLTLAKIMPGAAFGDYVSIVGVAMLSASVLSFGAIEGTVKRYPRLWVAGQRAAIGSDARSILVRVTLRFLAVAVLLAAINDVFGWSYSRLDVVIGTLFGLGTALQALMASLLRAVDRASALASFSLARSSFAFVAAITGGALAGWEGALTGEVLACVVSLAQGRWIALRAYRDLPAGSGEMAEQVPENRHDGLRLYLANTLSSVTGLGDRAFVNAALGAAAAGSYGVLAMVFQVGQLLVGILAQRIGTTFIKASYAGNTGYDAVRRIWLVFAGLLLVSGGMVGTLLLLERLNWPASFFDKYTLSPLSIILAGGVAAMQIYTVIEFYLLSRDQENGVLAASIIGAILLVGCFIIGSHNAWPLEWFIGSVFLAKAAQLLALVVAGRRAR